MSLAEKIRQDMIEAMKAKEKERTTVLRMILSAVKEAAIEKREDLDDEEVKKLLMSYAKKREETLVQMNDAGRADLAAKEESELAIVKAYLPTPLTDDELTDWATAKRLIAYLLDVAPYEIDACEAQALLVSREARHNFQEAKQQITWGEAKERIADLLGITKDILDAEERRRQIDKLATLLVLSGISSHRKPPEEPPVP